MHDQLDMASEDVGLIARIDVCDLVLEPGISGEVRRQLTRQQLLVQAWFHKHLTRRGGVSLSRLASTHRQIGAPE